MDNLNEHYGILLPQNSLDVNLSGLAMRLQRTCDTQYSPLLEHDGIPVLPQHIGLLRGAEFAPIEREVFESLIPRNADILRYASVQNRKQSLATAYESVLEYAENHQNIFDKKVFRDEGKIVFTKEDEDLCLTIVPISSGGIYNNLIKFKVAIIGSSQELISMVYSAEKIIDGFCACERYIINIEGAPIEFYREQKIEIGESLTLLLESKGLQQRTLEIPF